MSFYPRHPTPSRVLRKLFLTLFLRGRTSRGLRRDTAPKSVGSKLFFTLGIYALVGFVLALSFARKPLFELSLYLHSMTLVFLGMFVAASAGEVLFNRDEAEILMHRPVTPRAMLWAKIGVLVEVSLWLAGAFNLGCFYFGTGAAHPGWIFPLVHAFSSSCQALFCTGCIVMLYQLCLRWFGREKLEGLMTTAQVLVAVGAIFLGQLGPQLIGRYNLNLTPSSLSWLRALPSAWFAGIDDALTGDATQSSWILASVGVGATALVLWLAFGKLAGDYETGLQRINEVAAKPRARGGRRSWIDILVKTPPMSWWLRDSVSRASFLLTAAYLVRDRDVKLRMYPGIAPMLVMPLIFLLNETHPRHYAPGPADVGGMFSGYSVAFAGAYLGIIPMLGLSLIRYSQQWQAADLFRFAPMRGPASLCDGARRAILCFLTLPMLAVFGILVVLIAKGASHLALLIPGIMGLPIYALIPCIGGKAVPLSVPTEEAKSAGRGLSMLGVMMVSALFAMAATLAWWKGWFAWFLGIEFAVMAAAYLIIRSTLVRAPWPSLE